MRAIDNFSEALNAQFSIILEERVTHILPHAFCIFCTASAFFFHCQQTEGEKIQWNALKRNGKRARNKKRTFGNMRQLTATAKVIGIKAKFIYLSLLFFTMKFGD